MSASLDTLDRMPAHEEAAAMRKRIEEQEKEIAEKSAAPGKADSQEDELRTKEEYTFDFEWEDARGKVWRGRFRNHVLTIAMNQRVGALQAEMALNKPYESLDYMTREINLAVAHMMVSLDPEVSPTWGRDLRALHSTKLLFALYEEVASHEAIFHGLPTDPKRGKKDD